MKKNKSIPLIVLLIISLVAVGIYLRVIGSKKESSPETEKETSHFTNTTEKEKMPADSFIATPKEIAELIDKDLNQIAEFFHDKGNVTRHDYDLDYSSSKYNSSTFRPKDSNMDHYLNVQLKDSLKILYTFLNKNRFMMFFDEVAKYASEELTVTVDEVVYPAYKIGNCLFVKNGFNMSGDNYISTMYSVSQLKAKRLKATRQSKSLQDPSSNNED